MNYELCSFLGIYFHSCIMLLFVKDIFSTSMIGSRTCSEVGNPCCKPLYGCWCEPWNLPAAGTYLCFRMLKGNLCLNLPRVYLRAALSRSYISIADQDGIWKEETLANTRQSWGSCSRKISLMVNMIILTCWLSGRGGWSWWEQSTREQSWCSRTEPALMNQIIFTTI